MRDYHWPILYKRAGMGGYQFDSYSPTVKKNIVFINNNVNYWFDYHAFDDFESIPSTLLNQVVTGFCYMKECRKYKDTVVYEN